MAHKNKKKNCINNKREEKKKLFWKKRNPLLQGSIQTRMKARMVKWVLESLTGSQVPDGFLSTSFACTQSISKKESMTTKMRRT